MPRSRRRILVTRAAGLIGSELCGQLVECGHAVIALVHRTLAEIHSDCSDSVMARFLSRISCAFCSIAIHSVGARPVHTIIWVDGTEFRWARETAAA